MSNSPDEEPGWIDDFPDIPEAGVLYPWLLVGLILALLGIYLIQPPTTIASHPNPIASSATPEATPEAVSSRMRLAFVDSKESSFGFAADLMAKKVSELSHGRMNIEVLPGGKVDGKDENEPQLTRLMMDGKLSMGIITSSPLSNINSSFDVLDLPFLFKDQVHADRVLDGPIGQQILDGLEPAGLKGLGYLELGFRLFCSAKPLPTLEDFQGKKLRVMQSAVATTFPKALKAEAVPVPVNMIMKAAEQGLIDAADRTYPTYWDFDLYKVHRFITDSRHTYSVKVLLVNKKFYEALPPGDQQILQEAARLVKVEQRKREREDDQDVRLKCKQNGIQVFELSPQERERWVKACLPVIDEYVKLHGSGLMDKIEQAENEP